MSVMEQNWFDLRKMGIIEEIVNSHSLTKVKRLLLFNLRRFKNDGEKMRSR